MKKIFNQILKLQEEIKTKICIILSKELKLTKEDSIEIISVDCQEAYQWDTDGDEDKIICQIEVRLKSEISRKEIRKFLDKYQYRWRNCKIQSINDIMWGDKYTFSYDFYEL